MESHSTFLNVCFLASSIILTIAGVFQFGHLIGLAVYSPHFSFDSITLLQVGLISSGVWGLNTFIKIMKKLMLKEHHGL